MLNKIFKRLLTTSFLLIAAESIPSVSFSLATEDSTDLAPVHVTAPTPAALKGFVLGTGWIKSIGGDKYNFTLTIKGIQKCPTGTDPNINLSATGTENYAGSNQNLRLFMVRATAKPDWNDTDKVYTVAFKDWNERNGAGTRPFDYGGDTDFSWTLYCIPHDSFIPDQK